MRVKGKSGRQAFQGKGEAGRVREEMWQGRSKVGPTERSLAGSRVSTPL